MGLETGNLLSIPENQAAERPDGPDSWSQKEELGHLIDSAVNNHVRFVRASLEPDFEGPGYDQDGWVKVHGYQEIPWSTLIELWRQHNSILVHMIGLIPEPGLEAECRIGGSQRVTLGFLIEDYILHMQHHLDHILRRETVTEYPGAKLGV